MGIWPKARRHVVLGPWRDAEQERTCNSHLSAVWAITRRPGMPSKMSFVSPELCSWAGQECQAARGWRLATGGPPGPDARLASCSPGTVLSAAHWISPSLCETAPEDSGLGQGQAKAVLSRLPLKDAGEGRDPRLHFRVHGRANDARNRSLMVTEVFLHGDLASCS